MIAVIDHSNDSVRVLTLRVFQDLRNDSRLAGPIALNNPDTFSNLEAFLHLMRSDLNFKWLRLFCQECYKSILNYRDEPFAILELSISDFDSVTNLNLLQWVISDGFLKSVIGENIPVILVLTFKFIEVGLGCWIDLEQFYFFETWTDIFCNELGSSEILIQ